MPTFTQDTSAIDRKRAEIAEEREAHKKRMAERFPSAQPTPPRGKPHITITPGGERVVMLPEAEYRALVAAAENAADVKAAREGLQSLMEDGALPANLAYAIAGGAHPIAAWRTYRGLSQAQLAARAGLTQAAIHRLEALPPGAGRAATKQAIADALDAPVWSLGIEGD